MLLIYTLVMPHCLFPSPVNAHDHLYTHTFLPTVGCTVMIGVTIVIPVFMIIVGSVKMNDCPAQPSIPVYLVVGGVLGVTKPVLGVQGRLRRPLTDEEGVDVPDAPIPWHRRIEFGGSINFFLTVWFVLGEYFVFSSSSSNSNSNSNYRINPTTFQGVYGCIASISQTTRTRRRGTIVTRPCINLHSGSSPLSTSSLASSSRVCAAYPSPRWCCNTVGEQDKKYDGSMHFLA